MKLMPLLWQSHVFPVTAAQLAITAKHLNTELAFKFFAALSPGRKFQDESDVLSGITVIRLLEEEETLQLPEKLHSYD